MSEKVTIVIAGKDDASDELKKVLGNLEKQKRAVDDSSDSARNMGKASKFMKVGAVAAAAALAGLAVAGAKVYREISKSVDAAKEFERALVSAGAKANATEAQLVAMKNAAFAASSASEFSAKQAADAMGFLAQAGFEVNEQMEALPGVLNLASAGELELARAADIASNVLSGMGFEVKELARVNDVLVKAGNSANTSVEQLGQALSYAAPVAAGMKIPLEQVTAVIGKLSDAGIQGSRAGRSFNTIMRKMAPVAQQLGVDLDNATIAEIGFVEALERLKKGGLTSFNADLFGEAAPAVQALLDITEQTRGLQAALEDAGGTAQTVADKKIDTFAGAMNVLEGNIENVRIRIGDAFLPILQALAVEASNIAAVITDNTDTFNGLRDAVIDAVDVFADLLRVGGVVGSFFIFFTGVFESGWKVIKAVVNQVGALIAALGSLLLAITGNISGAKDAWGDMMDMQQEAIDQIVGIGDTMADSVESAAKFEQGAQDAASGLQNLSARARVAAQNQDDLASKTDAATAAMKEQQSTVGDMTMTTGENVGGMSVPSVEDEKKAAAEQRKKEAIAKSVALLDRELQIVREQDELRRRRLQRDKAIAEIRASDEEQAVKAKKIEIERARAAQDIAEIMAKRADEAERERKELEKAAQGLKEFAQKQYEIWQDKAKQNKQEREERAHRNEIAVMGLALARETDAIERARIERAMALAHLERQKLTDKERELEQLKIQKDYEAQIAAEKKKQAKETADGIREASSVLQGFGDLAVSNFAPLFDVLAGIEDGSANVADAIGATGQAAAGFAKSLGASAEAQAGIMAIFETAMGFATLWVNPAESAAHFLAAANFGLLASTGGASKGAAKTNPDNVAGDRVDNMRRNAENSAGLPGQEQRGSLTQVFDFSGSTNLQNSPDIMRQIRDASDTAEGTRIERTR